MTDTGWRAVANRIVRGPSAGDPQAGEHDATAALDPDVCTRCNGTGEVPVSGLAWLLERGRFLSSRWKEPSPRCKGSGLSAYAQRHAGVERREHGRRGSA